MPRGHIFADAAQPFTGYTCAEMRKHYGFPADLDGAGQTIGLAEWGSGYSRDDLLGFCKDQGLPVPVIDYVPIDGGQNNPDAECTLDIEVAHGMAPGATIRAYEAPSGPTYQTFGQQVTALLQYVLAEKDIPSVLSISYGDAEADWPADEVKGWNALIAQIVARGCTVVVASGDQGAYGTHVFPAPVIRRADAPATCPAAVAVGGTRVPPNGASERAWNTSGFGASGGGISEVFQTPAYQQGVNKGPMRGEPDVSMLADPQTGWRIFFRGKAMPIGGTSAAAPAFAALIAYVNQARAKNGLGPVGDILPTIYAHEEVFQAIHIGNNSFAGVQGFDAGAPWTPCCGLGVPKAAEFIALFAGEAKQPTPKPAPAPAPAPTPTPTPSRPVRIALGIDSVTPALQPFLQTVKGWLGKAPAFWGRYLDSYALTAAEAQNLLSWHIGILPIWNGTNAGNVATAGSGAAHAAQALAKAQSLGIPKGTSIVLDIERSFTPTAACLEAYAQDILAAEYRPVLYMEPSYTPHMDAYSAMTADLRQKTAIFASGALTASPWPYFVRWMLFWKRISTPPWAKTLPPSVAAWQFAINQMGDKIDLNLVNTNADIPLVFWQG